MLSASRQKNHRQEEKGNTDAVSGAEKGPVGAEGPVKPEKNRLREDGDQETESELQLKTPGVPKVRCTASAKESPDPGQNHGSKDRKATTGRLDVREEKPPPGGGGTSHREGDMKTNKKGVSLQRSGRDSLVEAVMGWGAWRGARGGKEETVRFSLSSVTENSHIIPRRRPAPKKFGRGAL